MLFLCKKFGNTLTGLNHVVFYNPNLTSEKCRKDSSNTENMVKQIHAGLEIGSKIQHGLKYKNRRNQTGRYWLITPNQETFCRQLLQISERAITK